MAAEPFMDAHGTQGFRGTPVEKHWSRLIYQTKFLVITNGTPVITNKIENKCLEKGVS
jgi:hypothetical protein